MDRAEAELVARRLVKLNYRSVRIVEQFSPGQSDHGDLHIESLNLAGMRRDVASLAELDELLA